MTFYPGDIPVEDVVIEPARETDIDLTLYTTATAALVDPSGTVVDAAGLTAAIEDPYVAVTWPSTSVLTEAGIYQIRVTLGTAGGAVKRLPAFPVVVQAEGDGWSNLDDTRSLWEQSRSLSDSTLHNLLEVAKEQVLAYAETTEADLTDVPPRYARAQWMQARNIYNASVVDASGGDMGEGSFVIRPFPLDWMIKQIITPKTRVPRFGTFSIQDEAV